MGAFCKGYIYSDCTLLQHDITFAVKLNISIIIRVACAGFLFQVHKKHYSSKNNFASNMNR